MNSPMTAPAALIVADAGEMVAVVRRHQDITEVFRLMKERLRLTNEFCDDAGGLTKGHTDKILGPSESKSWGPTTFDLFCEMFAIEFRAHIDLDAARRMEAIWEGRERPLFHHGKTGRISKKLIERAKPHVLSQMSRSGGRKRASCLSAKQVAMISRKGGKSRARKLTPQRRREIARKAGKASAAKRAANAVQARAAMLLPAPLRDFPALECPAPNAESIGGKPQPALLPLPA